MNTKLIDFIVEVLENKKGKDVKVLDISHLTIVADHFIICTGTSTTHIKALADEVEEKLKDEYNIILHHKEGYNSARWILLDFSDFVIHIFHTDDRQFYSLERIWADAKEVLTKNI